MEPNRIFSADQIQIHPDLPDIIKQYTKAVLKANPEDVLEFSWAYFKQKVEAEEERRAAEQRAQADAEAITA